MSTDSEHNHRLRQGLTVLAVTCVLAAGGWQLARAQDSTDAGAPPQAAADQGNADQGNGGPAGPNGHGRFGGGGPGRDGRAAMRMRGLRDFQEFREFQQFERWQQFRDFERWHHGFGRGFGAPMMRPAMLLDRPMLGAFRQLGLSPQQRQQVRTLLMKARPAPGSRQPLSPAQRQALLNPGDPGHASALQAARDRAAARLQRAGQLQQSLYDVLTPEQKTRLTQLLAQRQARMHPRFGGRGPGMFRRGGGPRPGADQPPGAGGSNS